MGATAMIIPAQPGWFVLTIADALPASSFVKVPVIAWSIADSQAEHPDPKPIVVGNIGLVRYIADPTGRISDRKKDRSWPSAEDWFRFIINRSDQND
jgi:hypothetical protein